MDILKGFRPTLKRRVPSLFEALPIQVVGLAETDGSTREYELFIEF